MFYVTLGLYGAASVLVLLRVVSRGDARSRTLTLAGRSVFGAGLVAQTLTTGALCLQGLHPLRDVAGALHLTAWLLVAAYLAMTLAWRIDVLGLLVGPLALALLSGSRLTPRGAPPPLGPQGLALLGKLHLTLVAFGVVAFALAGAVAAVYLLQDRALRHNRLGPLYRRTPPLATLDHLGRVLIAAGFPVFTLALVSGVLWVVQLRPTHGVRPEHLLAGVVWIVFAALLVARWTMSISARRAALLTVVGFAATVLVLWIYVGRRMLAG
ncbi:MAG: cytochrome c biogenesis protein CcsA [Proteobacteria bacterium]|nr:cytochrome c biogenesis protein CcsA [Pseudomonadota bacterium]